MWSLFVSNIGIVPFHGSSCAVVDSTVVVSEKWLHVSCHFISHYWLLQSVDMAGIICPLENACGVVSWGHLHEVTTHLQGPPHHIRVSAPYAPGFVCRQGGCGAWYLTYKGWRVHVRHHLEAVALAEQGVVEPDAVEALEDDPPPVPMDVEGVGGDGPVAPVDEDVRAGPEQGDGDGVVLDVADEQGEAVDAGLHGVDQVLEEAAGDVAAEHGQDNEDDMVVGEGGMVGQPQHVPGEADAGHEGEGDPEDDDGLSENGSDDSGGDDDPSDDDPSDDGSGAESDEAGPDDPLHVVDMKQRAASMIVRLRSHATMNRTEVRLAIQGCESVLEGFSENAVNKVQQFLERRGLINDPEAQELLDSLPEGSPFAGMRSDKGQVSAAKQYFKYIPPETLDVGGGRVNVGGNAFRQIPVRETIEYVSPKKILKLVAGCQAGCQYLCAKFAAKAGWHAHNFH